MMSGRSLRNVPLVGVNEKEAAMSRQAIDEAKVEEFLGRLIGDVAATAHSATVVLGDKLGLWAALAEGGPQTAEELAGRTGCNPRIILEWLNAQVVSEYCELDPSTGQYWLTPEQVAVLADPESPTYAIKNVSVTSFLHRDEEKVRAAYASGRGFGWHEHHHDFFADMAEMTGADYAYTLVPEWIPALDGVLAKLEAGARVADIGCGFGVPTILLAKAFPNSTFHGFDYHSDSIDAARKAAAEVGVSDRATFEVSLGESFPGSEYDLVCMFDALHDMGDPVAVARRVRESLAPDGTWLIAEMNAQDDVTQNKTPFGRILYSASSFICVPNGVSQSERASLGAAAGQAAIGRVVEEAGFSSFRLAAETPFNLVLEARP
jgi:2-polyprenyl-3-methyl-5-hydroxy-6-metoxy-1,4-benzoquinol methylase